MKIILALICLGFTVYIAFFRQTSPFHAVYKGKKYCRQSKIISARINSLLWNGDGSYSIECSGQGIPDGTTVPLSAKDVKLISESSEPSDCLKKNILLTKVDIRGRQIISVAPISFAGNLNVKNSPLISAITSGERSGSNSKGILCDEDADALEARLQGLVKLKIALCVISGIVMIFSTTISCVSSLLTVIFSVLFTQFGSCIDDSKSCIIDIEDTLITRPSTEGVEYPFKSAKDRSVPQKTPQSATPVPKPTLTQGYNDYGKGHVSDASRQISEIESKVLSYTPPPPAKNSDNGKNNNSNNNNGNNKNNSNKNNGFNGNNAKNNSGNFTQKKPNNAPQTAPSPAPVYEGPLDIKVCPECGGPVPSDRETCVQCGARLFK